MIHAMGFAAERTYWIANEWYWRITENATALTLADAVRDFAKPLVALVDRRAEVTNDGARIAIALGELRTHISVAGNVTARVALNHLISDLNRMLATAKPDHAFAIAIPRRYELCGVLLTTAELERLWGDPRPASSAPIRLSRASAS